MKDELDTPKCFPISPRTAGLETTDPQNPAATDATILVVDDSASLLDLLEMMLAGFGYRVLTATNSAAGSSPNRSANGHSATPCAGRCGHVRTTRSTCLPLER